MVRKTKGGARAKTNIELSWLKKRQNTSHSYVGMTSFFQRLDGSACKDLQISTSKVLGAIGRSCDFVLKNEDDWCGGCLTHIRQTKWL
jgi:hypothetical protein